MAHRSFTSFQLPDFSDILPPPGPVNAVLWKQPHSVLDQCLLFSHLHVVAGEDALSRANLAGPEKSLLGLPE